MSCNDRINALNMALKIQVVLLKLHRHSQAALGHPCYFLYSCSEFYSDPHQHSAYYTPFTLQAVYPAVVDIGQIASVLKGVCKLVTQWQNFSIPCASFINFKMFKISASDYLNFSMQK